MRTKVKLATSGLLLAVLAGIANGGLAHAQPDVVSGGGEANISAAGALQSQLAATATVTRSEVLARAASWNGVPYSQTSHHPTPYGTYRQDCSGFVSMTWGVPAGSTGGTNTVGLTGLGTVIPKNDLKPGDALIDALGDNNTRHVVLFEKWVDASRTSYWGYEQSGPNGSLGAKHHVVPYPYFGSGADYRPYRYDNIVDDVVLPAGASLSGDSKADIATVLPNGDVKAWRNGRGLTPSPWDAEATIATGFADDNLFCPDLDGDGRKDIAVVLANGDVKAWHNGRGITPSPWDGEATIATGFAKDNLFFADIDGDRKDDIITVLANGDVKVWHNGRGITPSPWDGEATIATGFAKDNLFFADIDGDGKDDIATVMPNGDVKVWHNGRGITPSPWDGEATIATGFSKDNLFFANVDGDGKDDIATVLANGDVKVWHNGRGITPSPWDGEATIATGFTEDNLHFA